MLFSSETNPGFLARLKTMTRLTLDHLQDLHVFNSLAFVDSGVLAQVLDRENVYISMVRLAKELHHRSLH